MRILVFNKSISTALSLFLLSQTESFAYRIPHNSPIQVQENVPTLPFLSVPRGGFNGPLETVKTKPVSNLKMSASSEALEVSGGESGGTATIPNEIFNLVKNIVGAGVLSLPAGKLNCNEINAVNGN